MYMSAINPSLIDLWCICQLSTLLWLICDVYVRYQPFSDWSVMYISANNYPSLTDLWCICKLAINPSLIDLWCICQLSIIPLWLICDVYFSYQLYFSDWSVMCNCTCQLPPGGIGLTVMCLATDVSLTADPGVVSSLPARSYTFMEIDHEIISTVILL